MSIGEVLDSLCEEFPGTTHSKIRFYEDQGLVRPERTPSQYRKYSTEDLERLRYVLRVQREHYLPLKVIKEHLDAMDRGLEPPALITGPQVPAVLPLGDGLPTARTMGETSSLRLSRKEILAAAEVEESFLAQLEEFGLVAAPKGRIPYTRDDLVVIQMAKELAQFGLEPRHLRAFRTAADREIGVVEQVLAAVRGGRDASATARADELEAEIAALSVRLHVALVRAALHRR
jgi:DNA-binding transcriptional MerR regulator